MVGRFLGLCLTAPPLSFGHFPRGAGETLPPVRPGHTPAFMCRSLGLRVPFRGAKGDGGIAAGHSCTI